MSTLQAIDINKTFGSTHVLRGVNLEAADGDFVVLVGPSGCGKSTLLAIIAGLEFATTGEIAIGQRIVNDIPPKDRNIAMVFQNYALYPTMTVRQNLTFGLEARKVPKSEHAAAVERVAKFLQIEPLLNRKPSQLSGGQRQRVAMGRALVRNPDLFLFDEPLSNLDANLRSEMRMEIKRLHQELGVTTVYVTHDQIEAMTLATRIAVMNGGVIQQYGTPAEVYDRPATTFVAAFMGTQPTNLIPVRIEVLPGGARRLHPEGEGGYELPLLPEQAALVPAGGEVTFGFRAETMTLAPDPARPPAPGTGRLTGKVIAHEPLGHETVVTLGVGSGRIAARLAPDWRGIPGDLLSFDIDMRKASFFDAQTGRRLD